MIRKILLVVTVLLLAACNPVHQVNRHNANRYYQAAAAADSRNDFVAAETYYYRALVNARLGGAPDATRAMLMYNLGRMKGRLGKCTEAIRLVEDSIVAEKKANTGKRGNLSKKYFVLARLYFAVRRYSDSLLSYNKGIEIVEPLGIEKTDPLGYARVLEHFVKVLRVNGKKARAVRVKRQIMRLKRTNRGRRAKYDPVYYDQCRA